MVLEVPRLSARHRFSLPAAIVCLAILSHVGTASNLPFTSSIPLGMVRGRIVSTNGCHLDLHSELKKFLLEPNGAQSYGNLEVDFFPGERPVLTIYDSSSDAGSSNQMSVETIQLWHVRTNEDFHNLLLSKGFVKKGPIEGCNMVGLPHQTATDDSGMTIMSPSAAAKKALLDAQSRGEDMFSMSYAAMEAFLEAKARIEPASCDNKEPLSHHRGAADGLASKHQTTRQHRKLYEYPDPSPESTTESTNFDILIFEHDAGYGDETVDSIRSNRLLENEGEAIHRLILEHDTLDAKRDNSDEKSPYIREEL